MTLTEITKKIAYRIRRRAFVIVFSAALGTAAFAGPAPSGLMCELLAFPETTTIADAWPEFTWIVNSDLTNDIQTAYQILVASTSTALDQNQGNVWDSGKIVSDNSINVTYGGSALAVNSTYYWKVRTWNKNDQASDWSQVQSFKTAASFLSYSTARYKQVLTPVAPVDIQTIASGHYLIDFGKDAFGYLRWTLPPEKLTHLRLGTPEQTILKLSSDTTSQQAGDVEVHFGEKLKDGRVDRSPGGSIRYYMTTVSLAPGTTPYEIHPPGTTTGISIPAEFGRVAPFRYVELVNCAASPSIEHFRQMSLHYPFDDTAAEFQCDNQTLNAVWELCRYSMKPTSFCAVYVDGDRERKPYEADAYINQLSHYSADREFSLARYSHEYLMTHETWPTEWRQHSIMMAWADYLYTGNAESLAFHYNQLKNDKLTVSPGSVRSDGLIDPSTTDIVDWPAGERDGYVFKPINTVVNAFYYHTLLLMKQIAEVLGKTADAQQFQQDAGRVYQSFQSVFFNTATGLYVDGEGTTHSSLHANMFPLAFGLVPKDKQPAVINFVKSKQMACSVYGAQYLLEGLYRSGQQEAALALMTSDSTRSWVNMMREGSTITMEAWGIAYKPNQDWNHAWGAAPGNIITRYLMGIQPIEPGFKKAIIHPHPGTLTNARIVTPTIRGPITLSLDKQADSCTFQITIPANTTARFVLPENCNSFTSVLLDGTPATLQQEGTVRFIDPIGSGTHVVTAQ
jgi:hypothetical protein